MHPLIITAADLRMKAVLETSFQQNQRAGYDVLVYNLNNELAYGRNFPYTRAHSATVAARHAGRLPCKARIIRNALAGEQRPLAWLDADAFAIRSFDEAFTGDFDIGVTMRRPSERGRPTDHHPLVYGYLNSGVVFVKPTDAADVFLNWWIDETEQRTENHSDQQALNQLVPQATNLTEYDKVFVLGGVRIKIFKTDDYNWYYWPDEPLPGTKVVHCKSNSRPAALADWGRRLWPTA